VPSAASAARDSLSTAVQTARSLGTGAGTRLVDAAQHAFIHGLRLASFVAFAIALIGAAVAWRLLPGGVALATPAVQLPSSAPEAEEAA
jgi:DHA2 family multidrug resistance protein-like MFS transporter